MNNLIKYYLNYSEQARLDEAGLLIKYPKNKDFTFIENKETDTQGFTYYDDDKKELIIAFRGSQQLKDWFTDFNAFHLVYPYSNAKSKIKVHKGFITAWKSVRVEVLDIVRHYLEKGKLNKVVVCGHSLGGALATLALVDIQYHYEEYFSYGEGRKTMVLLQGFVTGNPAVFNKAGAKSFTNRVPLLVRTFMRTDVVPKLPPKWFGSRLNGGYCHVGVAKPIGTRKRFFGLRVWLKTLRNPASLAANLTNHAISLYRKNL